MDTLVKFGSIFVGEPEGATIKLCSPDLTLVTGN
jgi:hypothetical protein